MYTPCNPCLGRCRRVWPIIGLRAAWSPLLKQLNCNSDGSRLSPAHARSPDDSRPAALRQHGKRRAHDAASGPERRVSPILPGSSRDWPRPILRWSLHARGMCARSPALRRSACRLRFGVRVAGGAVVLRARWSSCGIRLSAARALVDPSSVHSFRWAAVRVTLPGRPVCVVVGRCARGAVGWFRRGRRPLRESEVQSGARAVPGIGHVRGGRHESAGLSAGPSRGRGTSAWTWVASSARHR